MFVSCQKRQCLSERVKLNISNDWKISANRLVITAIGVEKKTTKNKKKTL